MRLSEMMPMNGKSQYLVFKETSDGQEKYFGTLYFGITNEWYYMESGRIVGTRKKFREAKELIINYLEDE